MLTVSALSASLFFARLVMAASRHRSATATCSGVMSALLRLGARFFFSDSTAEEVEGPAPVPPAVGATPVCKGQAAVVCGGVAE